MGTRDHEISPKVVEKGDGLNVEFPGRPFPCVILHGGVALVVRRSTAVPMGFRAFAYRNVYESTKTSSDAVDDLAVRDGQHAGENGTTHGLLCEGASAKR